MVPSKGVQVVTAAGQSRCRNRSLDQRLKSPACEHVAARLMKIMRVRAWSNATIGPSRWCSDSTASCSLLFGPQKFERRLTAVG